MNEWYSVRCIFRHATREDKADEYLYEERITLWHTTTIEEAILLAEKEANEYATKEICTYEGLAQAYKPFFEFPTSGSEVFSLMRADDSPPEQYIDFYFDTGTERQQEW